jgi:hypothetical protein
MILYEYSLEILLTKKLGLLYDFDKTNIMGFSASKILYKKKWRRSHKIFFPFIIFYIFLTLLLSTIILFCCMWVKLFTIKKTHKHGSQVLKKLWISIFLTFIKNLWVASSLKKSLSFNIIFLYTNFFFLFEVIIIYIFFIYSIKIYDKFLYS